MVKQMCSWDMLKHVSNLLQRTLECKSLEYSNERPVIFTNSVTGHNQITDS